MTREEIRLQVAISVIQGVLEAKHGVIGEVVPSVAVAIALRIADAFVEEWYRRETEEQKPAERNFPKGVNETADKLIAIAECLEADGDCIFNGYSGTECGKFLRELARKEK